MLASHKSSAELAKIIDCRVCGQISFVIAEHGAASKLRSFHTLCPGWIWDLRWILTVFIVRCVFSSSWRITLCQRSGARALAELMGLSFENRPTFIRNKKTDLLAGTGENEAARSSVLWYRSFNTPFWRHTRRVTAPSWQKLKNYPHKPKPTRSANVTAIRATSDGPRDSAIFTNLSTCNTQWAYGV